MSIWINRDNPIPVLNTSWAKGPQPDIWDHLEDMTGMNAHAIENIVMAGVGAALLSGILYTLYHLPSIIRWIFKAAKALGQNAKTLRPWPPSSKTHIKPGLSFLLVGALLVAAAPLAGRLVDFTIYFVRQLAHEIGGGWGRIRLQGTFLHEGLEAATIGIFLMAVGLSLIFFGRWLRPLLRDITLYLRSLTATQD